MRGEFCFFFFFFSSSFPSVWIDRLGFFRARLRGPASSPREMPSRNHGREKNGTCELTFANRAFADFVFGSLILHFFCVNFIN